MWEEKKYLGDYTRTPLQCPGYAPFFKSIITTMWIDYGLELRIYMWINDHETLHIFHPKPLSLSVSWAKNTWLSPWIIF